MRDPLNDGISSVQLIDCMGDDLMVVNAARVSMHKESEWEYDVKRNLSVEDEFGRSTGETYDKVLYDTKRLSERDVKLINYLAKHNHWTPFSHPQIQLRIKMPIFIARQWFKHMVGFTRNEVSRRYVSNEPELYFPKSYRERAENVKQGSSDETANYEPLWAAVAMQACGEEYKRMLEHGVCPEQARMVLPQAMYTEFIETGSLAAYARLANLRLDPHAQKEIQWYAQAVHELLSPMFPVSWGALTNK